VSNPSVARPQPHNPLAERLLEDARKRTAKNESPVLGKVALLVGAFALLVSPISILGWIDGAIAIGLGAAAVHRPVSAKQAKIAMLLGTIAILIGVFFFTLNVALR
jgi:hypothetical protein